MKRVLLTMDDTRYRPHTEDALRAYDVEVVWVPTDALPGPDADGVFIGPGSPFADMDAVLACIRRARDEGVPFVGT